ncbi:hypothetical protein HanRHA438_Chr10g0455021 [Helianthus annuus]|nr:hypothetical protein HanHA300_Chr10g0364091 [Helianthus annuus]KAJ0521993.1 hypothetical protein HanIR_Chr10g0477421 [Helianthus annuus]KAJ0696959.1 hypothetical protein HanLR1_Chr10g0363311 [Helianthus annuus]KAJ0700395.1 hypothetical protein HanOQP8_Chr10g0367351 [Helianthus annuus]KAJ0743867.1 hypothetical protein HanPI659440_Chr10g0380921 [Helianthus annuus]
MLCNECVWTGFSIVRFLVTFYIYVMLWYVRFLVYGQVFVHAFGQVYGQVFDYGFSHFLFTKWLSIV